MSSRRGLGAIPIGQKRSDRYWLRFLFVGLLNTAVGLSVTLMLLNIINISYWHATWMGIGIGMIFSYTLNRTFTFRSSAAHSQSIIRFVLVIACSYLISYTSGQYIALHVSTIWFILPSSYTDEAAVFVGNGLYTMINYWGQKHFVFNRK